MTYFTCLANIFFKKDHECIKLTVKNTRTKIPDKIQIYRNKIETNIGRNEHREHLVIPFLGVHKQKGKGVCLVMQNKKNLLIKTYILKVLVQHCLIPSS